jgi:hypothetical protein
MICCAEVHATAERIRTLANGTFFGEISLLTGQRRNATVRAITTCDLFVLDRDDFQLLLEQVPYLYLCYWCDGSHCWRTIRLLVPISPFVLNFVFGCADPSRV